jgi:pyruvate kinase
VAGKICVLTRIFDSMTARAPTPICTRRSHSHTRFACNTQDAPRPTRAEATDVANAVLDGVDAFLLGAETVRGAFPVATLSCVLAICAEAEKVYHHARFFHALLDAAGAFAGPKGLSARESMASTLVRVAEKTGAKLVVVFTKSGRHAAAVAKWRPGVPILALFPPQLHAAAGVRWRIGGRAECRAALLRRGVLPMLADPKDGLSEDAMLRSALAFAQATGLVRAGDVVCLSHKLRDDISISVLHVGDQELYFGSGGGAGAAAGAPPSSASRSSLLLDGDSGASPDARAPRRAGLGA